MDNVPPVHNQQRDSLVPPLLVFAVISAFAYIYQWKVDSICWGIWLSEVILIASIALISLLRILLHVLQVRKLEPEFQAPNDSEWQEKLKDAGNLKRLAYFIPALLAFAFVLFCYFGFFAFYGVALQMFFSVQTPQQAAGFLAMYWNIIELIRVLIDDYWVIVVGTLALKRDAILSGPPAGNILELGASQLFKIHFCLLVLPPIALCAQKYLGNYETAILILLLLIFYFPWEQLLSRSERQKI